MSATLIAVDRAVVERSFREWQAEQAQLEAELADSLAALDAYQSNLDNWQQELARERQELHETRAAIDYDRSTVGDFAGQREQLSIELTEARERISSLTSALLTRTEELRELDHQRNSALAELATLRTREQDLSTAFAAQQQSNEAERSQWEQEINQLRDAADKAAELAASGNHVDPSRDVDSRTVTRPSASPVLGSVMEQFGKLRQQRSLNRLNPKPR